MSAHEQMRQMLDQLMGTGRDGENNRYRVRFSDPRVCKSFLLGCCPHDILASTQMDLGECPRIHDLALRADYEAAAKTRDYLYDFDAMEHLQSFINDCDRRTEQAKRRLAETQEELSAEVAAKLNKVHELAEQIGKKLAKAEQLGAEGNVEESLKAMEEVEDYRKKKAAAEQEYRNSMPASSYQQQKLRVCEVCSAYLGIHDNDRRLADHFGGKLHLGFIKIREKLDELTVMVAERGETDGRSAPNEATNSNDRSNDRTNATEFRRRERSQEPDKRDRERERFRKKSRSRSRSRTRRLRRSRSGSRTRDRRRRSRSGSRPRRSVSPRNSRRSRSRSRSRGGSSSKSETKHSRSSRRSRSKDRRRSPDENKERKRNRSRSQERRRSNEKEDKERLPSCQSLRSEELNSKRLNV